MDAQPGAMSPEPSPVGTGDGTAHPSTPAPLPEPVPEKRPEPVKPKPKPTSRQPKPATTTKTTAPATTGKPATTRSGDKLYYIQLVATTDRKAASRLKERMEAQGYNVYLLTSRKKGTTLYRVRIGVFKDYRQARSVATKIGKEAKLKPWIVAQ